MEITADIEQPALFPDYLKTARGLAQKARDAMAEYVALTKEHGAMFTQAQVALLCDVSTARVAQWINEGKFKLYVLKLDDEVMGKYISARDLTEFASKERLRGRPPGKAKLLLAALNTK